MSEVFKRSVVISKNKTSVSLEDEFWTSLREIVLPRGARMQDVLTEIDSQPRHGSLSSAIRLFVLDYYRLRAKIAAHHVSFAATEERNEGLP